MNGRRSGTAFTKANQGAQTRTNPYAEGSRYYDLYESNPLVKAKANYKKTGWDSVMNFLGFRSGYDNMMSQFDIGIADYDAQIEQLKGEDEYNSPEAQAARMKAAGQNPDLLGTGGVAGASEFAMEQTSPTVSEVDPNFEKVGSFLTGIAQAVTMAAGMSSQVLTSVGAYQDIQSKKMGLAKSEEELADYLLGSLVSDGTFDTDKGKVHWKDAKQEDLVNFVSSQAWTWAEDHGLGQQQSRRFRDSVVRKFQNNPGAVFDKWTANEKSRQEWSQTAGSKFYTGKKNDFDGIIEALQPLTQLYDDYREFYAIATTEHQKNQAGYELEFNGTTAGKAQNASNEQIEQSKKLEKDTKAAQARIMSALDKEAKSGNYMAFFLQLVVPILFARLEGAHLTSSTGVDSDGNESTNKAVSF